MAAHLWQGRDRLEAHALLGAGWRPIAGPSEALGTFRLPVTLPLEQTEVNCQLQGNGELVSSAPQHGQCLPHPKETGLCQKPVLNLNHFTAT
jgi:hypothetical protein